MDLRKDTLRRFELQTDDAYLIDELKRVLYCKKLSRRELAVILLTLRVRPVFDLKDFDI